MLKATTRISSPIFKALFTPELEYLSNLFLQNNYELRMAGGPVRDLLMGKVPSDIDFASTATPTQMKELFERENVRMLHKRGEEHGTITCRIHDKENFEITTLRIDVVCDGRRAEVQFTTDWSLDAFRRDLTINSLFLGLDGTVYDYTGGIEDIKSRKITFVGNPVTRLEEDYLRILRYFRFYGRFSATPYGHEEHNLEAIIKCREGLKGISGERLWTELHKILVGRFAAEVMDVMIMQCGLAPFIGLTEASVSNFKKFQRVAAGNLSSDGGTLACEPSTMLASLLSSVDELEEIRSRLKFSNVDYGLAKFIIEQRSEAAQKHDELRHFRHLLADLVFEGGDERMDMWRLYCSELMKYVGAIKCLREFETIEKFEKFPVGGIHLMEAGVPKGPRMRAVLAYLFEVWKKNDFKLSTDELLKFVDDEEIAEVEAKLLAKGPKGGPVRKKRRT